MRINKELLKGSTSLLVLRVISEEDMYGYRIIREIATRSRDAFALKEGTLYPILHMLEKEGHVSSYNKDSENGRTRRYYHITTQGRLYLATRVEEWQFFSDAVSMVLRLQEG